MATNTPPCGAHRPIQQEILVTDPVCPPGTIFADAVESVRSGEAPLTEAVDRLMQQMTDDELLWLLDGDLPVLADLPKMMERFRRIPFEAGRIDRLGIPGMRFTDGPRGVVMQRSTCFPVAVSRASTFDVDIERAIGDAIGKEARAHGANLFGGICVNLAPIPGWGRSQESYGEDPLVLGAMGAALAKGTHPWVMSTVKHFALNSMEQARFVIDVEVDEKTLHEVYLPHFRVVVEAGVDSVMTAYNSVNGQWAGENRHLISDILRAKWGFEGFTHTDWIWGLRHPVESVHAGQDLEMPFRQQRSKTLPKAMRDGLLTRSDIERSAKRLLSAQIRLALRAAPTPPLAVVASKTHRKLARDAARKGTVMLRNEVVGSAPMLPLDESAVGKVAVFGKLADSPNLGDHGSSAINPPSTSSVVEGLRERLGNKILYVESTDSATASDAARKADVAIVVVGFTMYDEGESVVALDADALQLMGGKFKYRPAARLAAKMSARALRRNPVTRGGDRQDLHLGADDVALIESVASANPRTVVIVIGGGTVMLEPWDRAVAAILLAWYPGMEGGRALADILLGDEEPGGRLPVAIPKRREHLPVVDWHARNVTYPRWWGQRKLDHDGETAAYPFGFGLGYTEFDIDSVTAGPVEGERFKVTASVTNTGSRAGRHVVQIYATTAAVDGESVYVLIGFAPVTAGAGEQVEVTIECSLRPLQRWTGAEFENPTGAVVVKAASWSGDPASKSTELHGESPVALARS